MINIHQKGLDAAMNEPTTFPQINVIDKSSCQHLTNFGNNYFWVPMQDGDAEVLSIVAVYRSTCDLSYTWAAAWKLSDSTGVGQNNFWSRRAAEKRAFQSSAEINMKIRISSITVKRKITRFSVENIWEASFIFACVNVLEFCLISEIFSVCVPLASFMR